MVETEGLEHYLDDGLVGWDTQALEFALSSSLVPCLIGWLMVAQALELAPTFFHLPCLIGGFGGGRLWGSLHPLLTFVGSVPGYAL